MNQEDLVPIQSVEEFSFQGNRAAATKGTWSDATPAEIQVAQHLAPMLAAAEEEGISAASWTVALMGQLGFHQFDGMADSKPVIHSRALAVVPTDKLDLPFAANSADVSSNLLAVLMAERARATSRTDLLGFVATPRVLADDMVKLAAAAWVGSQMSFPIKVAAELLWQTKPATESQRTKIHELLAQASWYDPCVGCGVFPLSIFRLYKRHGFTDPFEIIDHIHGAELDSAALTVTIIRLSLVAGLSGKYSRLFLDRLHSQLVGSDALEQFNEQASLGPPIDRRLLSHDLVIGNPPYVRADRLSRDLKARLAFAFPSVAGGTVDLYSYFIAHGLMALSTGGVLCYVTPVNFQRSKSGYGTRRFVRKLGAVRVTYDFDELPVFERADVHSGVFVVQRGAPQTEVHAAAFESLPSGDPLLVGLTRSRVISSPPLDAWPTLPNHAEMFSRASAQSLVPLIDYVGEIYSGVKTGLKRAYFVPRALADQWLGEDESLERFLRPMLKPARIRAWRPDWDGAYMLVPSAHDALPAVLISHLSRFREQLQRRVDRPTNARWYDLRTCSYYEIFNRPKIIFPDIASTCRFAVDERGFILPDGAFMLPKVDYYLLGILNSSLGEEYFRASCTSIGNPYTQGRLRFKKAYVQNFPVRVPDSASRHLVENIAKIARTLSENGESKQLKSQLDDLVSRIYSAPAPSS